MLALANPGVGKDRPRQVNQQILSAVGRGACIGDAIASGQGLEDAMLGSPSMLLQTDEILERTKMDGVKRTMREKPGLTEPLSVQEFPIFNSG